MADCALRTRKMEGGTVTPWGAIIPYCCAAFLYFVALYLYIPTLPVYAQTKTSDVALIGLILSMYGIWQAIVRLPVGIAADWLGWRKPFVVVGFGLAALGAWVMGTAGDVNDLIVGRAITGLAAGAWVPLVAVFSSLYPPREAVRASGLLSVIGTLARISATGLTGFLNDLGGYRTAFFAASAAAGLAILALSLARETRQPPRRPSVKGIATLVTRRDVLLPSLLSAVGRYVSWGVTFSFVPLLATDLGASDVFLSLLVLLNLVAFTLGNLAATALVGGIGEKSLVAISFVLQFIGVAGAAIAPGLSLLMASQLCLGLSLGIGYPVLMGLSIRDVDHAERTSAVGLHQAVYAIGMFAGPWLSGILAQAVGIRPMFGLTAVVSSALGLFGTFGGLSGSQRTALQE